MAHTWIEAVDGKVKCLPQIPGYVGVPNSAQDWLMPNHLNLPLAGELLVVGGAELVALGLAVVVDVFNVVDASPGKHWLYQSFW